TLNQWFSTFSLVLLMQIFRLLTFFARLRVFVTRIDRHCSLDLLLGQLHALIEYFEELLGLVSR
uniref:Uncharacterized protein n=1 Tax=Gouania willdenowi TaxID=441366 RepID=A0A8C5FYC9_GOUWI